MPASGYYRRAGEFKDSRIHALHPATKADRLFAAQKRVEEQRAEQIVHQAPTVLPVDRTLRRPRSTPSDDRRALRGGGEDIQYCS
jgi:hypothetical protein